MQVNPTYLAIRAQAAATPRDIKAQLTRILFVTLTAYQLLNASA